MWNVVSFQCSGHAWVPLTRLVDNPLPFVLVGFVGRFPAKGGTTV